MPSRIPPIARIRLARSPLRLLTVPLLLVAAGAALAATAWIGPLVALEPAWIALVAGGVLLGLVGLAIAARLLTLRLDVEEAAVRTRWLGGERLHPLVPGPVTRVRLRGPNASSLRTRTGWLGWAVGGAVLRGEERIQIVRLAPTDTAILVPTEGGRLAIAAASEPDLIDALSRAARARQRLEELAPPERAAPLPEPQAAPEPEPHILTGIERAELEERQALERAGLAPEAGDTGAGLPAPQPEAVPRPAQSATDVEERPARAWGHRRASVALSRPRPSAAFVLLPLIGAGGIWLLAVLSGRLPEAGTDLGRLTSLGLVLAGPATSVGAIMARAWWPRLVGVVVTSGLATSVFVARALLGGLN
ncbi:MAG TPA: hypothetical protein VFP30_01625 [Candidatus Limnocylindria bacterium]|nr:hypothetical protein [Candidatus Limnocylindria bacterium]